MELISLVREFTEHAEASSRAGEAPVEAALH
jgi:hypothetical protein